MDTWDSECAIKSMEKPGKILEWSALPLVDSSSSDSDSNSYQIVLHSGTKKVSGHPAQGTDLAASEQIQECTGSFSGHMEGGVGCISLSPLSKLSPLPKVLLRFFSPHGPAASARDLNPAAVSLLCRPLVGPPGELPYWTLYCVLLPLKDFFF